jgi:signal transduction histidine kinase
MQDLSRPLVGAARESKSVADFWDRAASLLRDAAGAVHVVLRYEGQRQRGEVKTDGQPGAVPRLSIWSDDTGRRVEAELHGLLPGETDEALQAALDLTAQLAAMVGQRTALEHDQRLGNFVIELSRWLLAAPERDLMLRYTLQSVMRLYDAEGAYAALLEPADDDHLRIVVALGRSAELDGMRIPLDQSTTGRVVKSGEALITDNIREEPDIYLPPSALSAALARAALIVPLQSAGGVLGAIGLVRYRRVGADAQPPPSFTLADLHFFMGVAAHVAGGLELSHVVRTTRATADRAVAMVNASPLPLLLVDTDGHLHSINEAGRRVLGLQNRDAAVGTLLADLGITRAEGTLADALSAAAHDEPWHGRVLVTLASGDRRICDCTVTDLEGLGSTDLLVALYDRTEELRAQHEMVAREKLATVGEIASGVAHEVNNPLATIRMEAELLKADTNPETGAAALTIIREVDRAASIIRSLMQLVRRTDATPTPVQLNHLLLDLTEIRRNVLRSDAVTLQTDLDDTAPPVLGLGQELMQVVLHLVNNAEHAVRGRAPGVIRITTRARDGWVRLLVEDSGHGVRQDIRGRIFEPFFSTKSPEEGSGLGLTVCQRVVSGLGGRIRVEDSDLGGARFVVELPAAPIRSVEELDIR